MTQPSIATATTSDFHDSASIITFGSVKDKDWFIDYIKAFLFKKESRNETIIRSLNI